MRNLLAVTEFQVDDSCHELVNSCKTQPRVQLVCSAVAIVFIAYILLLSVEEVRSLSKESKQKT